MIPAIHNPHIVATPSERLFAERYRQSRERMQLAAKVHSEKPTKPPCTRDFNPSSTAAAEVITVYEPEPIEQWRERQKQIHPPIEMFWFRIVDDFGSVNIRRPSFDVIQRATVAEFPMVTLRDVLGPSQTAAIVSARQIAMYLAREIAHRSFPEIGRCFDRDHSTAMHAYNKIRMLIKTNQDTRALVEKITASLGAV